MTKKFIPVLSLLLSLCILLCLWGCKKEEEASPSATAAATQAESSTLPAAPVDFEELQAINSDIYAYIHVPGTNIDYPVLQSSKDDNYYLRRNFKGQSAVRGCIFSQSHNSRNFSDPVTVLYGHHTSKNDMFSQLLYFEDTDFFNKHDVFYIYVPNHILTYSIVSAHTYDDRHILNSFDFTNPLVLYDFQQEILSPSALERNVREGAKIYINDRILILSTCAEAVSGGSTRYLVNGVLISNEPTQ